MPCFSNEHSCILNWNGQHFSWLNIFQTVVFMYVCVTEQKLGNFKGYTYSLKVIKKSFEQISKFFYL